MTETRTCRACGESVSAPADQYEVFEQMHYVCFHYAFEHRGDRDVECDAGGCPAAGASVPAHHARVGGTDLAQAGNTVIPAILALRRLGYRVSRLGDMFTADYNSSFGSARFVAEDPVVLLGLVKLSETRRPWGATDAEIGQVLSEFDL